MRFNNLRREQTEMQEKKTAGCMHGNRTRHHRPRDHNNNHRATRTTCTWLQGCAEERAGKACGVESARKHGWTCSFTSWSSAPSRHVRKAARSVEMMDGKGKGEKAMRERANSAHHLDIHRIRCGAISAASVLCFARQWSNNGAKLGLREQLATRASRSAQGKCQRKTCRQVHAATAQHGSPKQRRAHATREWCETKQNISVVHR